jgi:hypothetical protein
LLRARPPSGFLVSAIFPVVVLLQQVFVGHGGIADHDRFHSWVLRQQRLDPRDLLSGEGHISIVTI